MHEMSICGPRHRSPGAPGERRVHPFTRRPPPAANFRQESCGGCRPRSARGDGCLPSRNRSIKIPVAVDRGRTPIATTRAAPRSPGCDEPPGGQHEKFRGLSRSERGPRWRGGTSGTATPAPVRLRPGSLRRARAGRASVSERPEGEDSAPIPSPSQFPQGHLPTDCRTSGTRSPPMRGYWGRPGRRPGVGGSDLHSRPRYRTTDRHPSLPEGAFRSSDTCSPPSERHCSLR